LLGIVSDQRDALDAFGRLMLGEDDPSF